MPRSTAIPIFRIRDRAHFQKCFDPIFENTPPSKLESLDRVSPNSSLPFFPFLSISPRPSNLSHPSLIFYSTLSLTQPLSSQTFKLGTAFAFYRLEIYRGRIEHRGTILLFVKIFPFNTPVFLFVGRIIVNSADFFLHCFLWNKYTCISRIS